MAERKDSSHDAIDSYPSAVDLHPSRRKLEVPPLIAGWRIFRQLLRTPFGATAIAAAIIAVLGGPLLLSHQGFCIQQRRFLSQDEYFGAAIRRVVNSRRLILETSVPGAVKSESLKVIPYSDETEFRERNPNCCKIVSHADGPVPSLSERLFGAAAVVVSVTYQANFLDERGQPQSTTATSEYAVSNCGRAWDARH